MTITKKEWNIQDSRIGKLVGLVTGDKTCPLSESEDIDLNLNAPLSHFVSWVYEETRYNTLIVLQYTIGNFS